MTLTALTVSMALSGPAAAQQPNAPLVVDSTADEDDSSGSDGVCATVSGSCTLRAAISQANYNRGPDAIEFNIPGDDVHRIQLGSALPSITDLSGGVSIDGYTQPGAVVNTDPLLFNGTIKIEVAGINTLNVFTIEAPENVIRGLAVFEGHYQIELRNENADGNLIVGNIIGTDVGNTSETYAAIGVVMNTGPDRNTVGTPELADRNVITGNGSIGIRVNHGGTSENVIQNNIVGLDPTGTISLSQNIGIDLQWWTWGNLVGGDGPGEGNLVGGHGSGGVDFSHMSTGNSVLGNRIGTTPDGRSATEETANRHGVIVKDDPTNNYVANNIIGGNRDNGVWHKHNFTARNTFIHNRIGVGPGGEDIGNGHHGISVTGHDDLYFDNINANNLLGAVDINNESALDNRNSEDELTERTAIRLGSFYNNGGPIVSIDDESHPSQDQPTITGVGPGEVYGGETCPGCTIDIYGSGAINSDGTVTAASTGVTDLRLTVTHSGMCVDVVGNSTAPQANIIQSDCDGDGGQRYEVVPGPSGFALRAVASGMCLDVFSYSQAENGNVVQWPCNGGDNQALRWSGNSLIFAHSGNCLDVQGDSLSDGASMVQRTCDGTNSQRFHPGTSIASTWIGSVTADGNGEFSMGSAEIEAGMVLWALSLTADGETSVASGHVLVDAVGYGLGSDPDPSQGAPGFPTPPSLPTPYQPEIFECSAADGVLSWSDAGADAYYVFATTDGQETYLGGHATTSLNVAGADSYRVTHWRDGFPKTATCDGPGPEVVTFECSAVNGVLAWDDAGADTYYVFAITGSDETYLGGHATTSLNVAGADSYRVTHWLSGQTTATCDGPGPDIVTFECSAVNDVLSWDDAGADTYYVFAITGSDETYLGGHATTSLAVAPADSYRVTHWLSGQTTTTCDGPGGAPPFSCSVAGDTLSWDDAGANAYYIFAITGPDETYLGGHTTTSLVVAPADSYRVTHWLSGKTTATCDGA